MRQCLIAHFAACAIPLLMPGRAAAQEPVQVVSPGESIQEAIRNVADGGRVLVRPGTYTETADPVNGLAITRSVSLIGLSTATDRVVLKASGTQKNGIVVVPAAHTSCMSCHRSMAPPFELLPEVDRTLPRLPPVHDVLISGITIEGFRNNGVFTRNVQGFSIADIQTVDIPNYGIFPTLSSNGLIADSRVSGSNDSGIWIETSQNVTAVRNLVENNLMGIQVSNSDSVLLENNEVHGNTAGIANLFLPYLFADSPVMRRVTVRNNRIHDNNRPNTAAGDPLLSIVPSGIGVLHLGAHDSIITANKIENNSLAGIAVVDFCVAAAGGPLDCSTSPAVPSAFLPVSAPSGNTVIANELRGNGRDPAPDAQFRFAAGDIALLTRGDNANCFSANRLTTFYSTLGFLPACH